MRKIFWLLLAVFIIVAMFFVAKSDYDIRNISIAINIFIGNIIVLGFNKKTKKLLSISWWLFIIQVFIFLLLGTILGLIYSTIIEIRYGQAMPLFCSFFVLLGIAVSILFTKPANLFDFTYNEFRTFSLKRVESLYKLERKRRGKFIENYFKDHPNINWLIIYNSENKIYHKGTDPSVPSNETLMQIAKAKKHPVLFCSRTMFFE